MRGLSFLLALAAVAMGQPPVPHPLFDGDAVHDVWLFFDSPNWYEQLRDNFKDSGGQPFQPAALVWNDRKLDRVGVRFQGGDSYEQYPGSKKPLQIRTDAFTPGARLGSLSTLNLHNAFKDPSYIREKVYSELAAAAGLTVPRTNYAALYINGIYWGLYVLTEEVDSEFLENHFGAGETGNLYKGEPRGTLEWRGPDAADYEQDYRKLNNREAADWSGLVSLITLLNRGAPDGAQEGLEDTIDIENALTMLALNNLTAKLDSYIGSGQNYYLYRRVSGGKWVFIPGDPSDAYGNFSAGLTIDNLERLEVQWLPRPAVSPGQPVPPNPRAARPLAQRLWEIPEYRLRYLRKVNDLLKGIASADVVLERMETLRNRLRPYVEAEERSMFTPEQFERAFTQHQRWQSGANGPAFGPGDPPPLRFEIPGLERFIRARAENVAGQLEPQNLPE